MPTAIAALESADARLATVSDPAVTEVRAALARELAALRAVNVPDIGSVLAQLTAIEANVARVPGARCAGRERPPAGAAAVTEIRRPLRACRTPAARGMGRPVLLSTHRSVALATRHARGRSAATAAVLDCSCSPRASPPCSRTAPAYADALRSAIGLLDDAFDPRHESWSAPPVPNSLQLAAIDVDPAVPEVGTAAQLLQRVIRSSSPPPAQP